MSDLKNISERLKELGGQRPTPESRREVEGALANKWEGVQVTAAKILANWGGPESVSILRDWLHSCDERKYGWSVTGVAVNALAKCVSSADVDWVLEEYFERPGVAAKHELLPLVLSLSPDNRKVRERLSAESRSPDRDRRQAAMKAIGNMEFADRGTLLEPFVGDPDPEIRRGSKFLLAR